jgi:hypothetical protein
MNTWAWLVCRNDHELGLCPIRVIWDEANAQAGVALLKAQYPDRDYEYVQVAVDEPAPWTHQPGDVEIVEPV